MKILILGDSFVEGVGAADNHGWAYLLKKMLLTHAFTISGIGGDTISKINSRISEFTSLNFDFILLEIGLNDSRYRPSIKKNEIDIRAFENGISDFIKLFHLKIPKAKIALVSLSRVNEELTAPYKEDKYYQNAELEKYDQILKNSAHKLGVHYIEIPKLNDTSGALADGLHPSDIGHNLIKDAIAKFLSHELV